MMSNLSPLLLLLLGLVAGYYLVPMIRNKLGV